MWIDGKDAEDDDRHPEAVYPRIALRRVVRARALKRHLKRRVQVVVVVAEQHGEAHLEDDRQQQHRQRRPTLAALALPVK